jgi:DNA-binding CsgD family transcriptional regulator
VLRTPFERVLESVRAQQDGLEYAATHGVLPRLVAFLRVEHANSLIRLGRWDEAEDELAHPHPVGGVGARYLASMQASMHTLRGRYDAARTAIRRRGAVNEAGEAAQHAAPWAEAILRLHLFDECDAPLSVPRLLGESSTNADALPVSAWRARAAVDGIADYGVGQARMEVDGILAELAAARAAAHGAPLTAAIDNWLAVVAAERSRIDGMDPRAWAEAVAAARRRTDAELEIYTQFRYAEALVSAGDGHTASRELVAAYERATALLAAPLATSIKGLARRARLKLPGVPTMQGADVLTPRETEVLQLVSQGLTNSEVGKRLFISGKTASVHLSNAMAKLGATNRTEAAHVARERGLLDRAPASE